MRRGRCCLLVFLASILMAPSHAQLFSYRPGREYRTITAGAYMISIQKSGRVDALLTSGEAVFKSAQPAVWLDGEKGPKPLDVDGRSSVRESINDSLGKGQGMLLKKGNCEWVFRTYPDKPFFTVQAAYVNNTKKPVRVKVLAPWSTGWVKDSYFSLGEGSGASLAAAAPDFSVPYYAGVNGRTMRALAAGFLAASRGANRFTVEAGPAVSAPGMAVFRAECVYEPPAEVAPGGKLWSDPVYIAVGDYNPFDGLERFASAAAAVNQVRPRETPLPHGFYADGAAATEASLIRIMTSIAERWADWGLRHVTLGGGWERGSGDWTPDPARFPQGMAYLSAQAHALGLTFGVELRPFIAGGSAQDARIVDPTNPAARDYLRALGERLANEWNLDAVDLVDTEAPLRHLPQNAGAPYTPVESIQFGLEAIRSGLGDKVFAAADTQSLAAAPYIDASRPAAHDANDVDALSALYFAAPSLWVPQYRVTVAGNPAFERDLLHALLLGAVIQVRDAPDTLDAAKAQLLRALSGARSKPARPLDLFGAKRPSLWAREMRDESGEWTLAGVLNWDEAGPATVALKFGPLGLKPDGAYAVYDLVRGVYHGVAARGGLDITLGPGSGRLLAFRAYRDRPILLSGGGPWGAPFEGVRGIEWDPRALELRGRVTLNAAGRADLTLLVPESYRCIRAECGGEAAFITGSGQAVTVGVAGVAGSQRDWRIAFEREPQR